MKFTDIVELAKQGYKPADIRELVAIANESETKEAEQKTPEDEMQDKAEDQDAEASATESDKTEDAIDYKKLYEDEKKKTENLQQKLTNKDMSADDVKESDLDTVLEAVKGFM